MAKAKKLPSGNWRVQISMDGERRSFTAPTKKEAELMALEWVNGKEEQKIPAVKKTVGQAVEEYIQSKENLLSPSSTRGYWIIYNNSIDLISSILLSDITEKHLQNWINSNAAHYAAKSVKSQFGLVRAALRQNKIKIDFESILLPRQSKEEKIIPDEKQISIILHIVENTSVELPVTRFLISSILIISFLQYYTTLKGKIQVKLPYSVIHTNTSFKFCCFFR